MNINYIGIGIILIILGYGLVFYLLCKNHLFPYLDKKNEIREKEIKKIINDENKLNEIKENEKKLAKPEATKEICMKIFV